MTKTRWVLIDPHDTMFFRDGRHFNQEDEGAVHAVSMFPPSPRTVALMLRAALAAGKGWKDGENWMALGDAFTSTLGDGPHDLGRLTFAPPRLALNDNGKITPLYPAPLALVTGRGATPDETLLRRLAPGEPLGCDLGEGVRLPEIGKSGGGQGSGGWKGVDGQFITHEGLRKFLEGKTPSANDLLAPEKLITEERRVGIARVTGTRLAADGMLYTAVHRRLKPMTDQGLGKLTLCAGVKGAGDWPLTNYRPFGGEHRFAWLEALRPSDALEPPRLSGKSAPRTKRYAVIAISPLRLDGDGWRRPGGRLGSLPGAIVSACIGKPQMHGGWSSTPSRSAKPSEFGPQALRPFAPAGSVWFMEAETANVDWSRLPEAIGADSDTKFGFGGCVYGTW